MDTTTPFDLIRAHFGSLTALAKLLGFPYVSTVSNWQAAGRIPPEWCEPIERASGGAVRAEQLRGDLDWVRDAEAGHVIGYVVPVRQPAPDHPPTPDLADSAQETRDAA